MVTTFASEGTDRKIEPNRALRWFAFVTIAEALGFATATAAGAAVAWTLGMLPSTLGIDVAAWWVFVLVGLGGITLLASIPVPRAGRDSLRHRRNPDGTDDRGPDRPNGRQVAYLR